MPEELLRHAAPLEACRWRAVRRMVPPAAAAAPSWRAAFWRGLRAGVARGRGKTRNLPAVLVLGAVETRTQISSRHSTPARWCLCPFPPPATRRAWRGFRSPRAGARHRPVAGEIAGTAAGAHCCRRCATGGWAPAFDLGGFAQSAGEVAGQGVLEQHGWQSWISCCNLPRSRAARARDARDTCSSQARRRTPRVILLRFEQGLVAHHRAVALFAVVDGGAGDRRGPDRR